MRKCKSLLFREYKLSKSHYFFSFIILILFLGLVFLTILLNRDESQETIGSVAMFMSLLFAVLTGCVCADDAGVYRSDINVGWHTYSYCLPISLFEKTMVRYLVKVFSILIGTGITAFGCRIIAIGAGTKADMKMMFVYLFMVEIYLLFQLAIHTVSLVTKNIEESKKLRIIISGIILGIIILSVIILGSAMIPINSLALDMTGDELGVALPNMIIDAVIKLIDRIHLILFPLLIVLLAAGFAVTYKTYERRRV